DHAVKLALWASRPEVVAEGDARHVAVLPKDARNELLFGAHRLRRRAGRSSRTLTVPTGRLVVVSTIMPLYIPAGCRSGTRSVSTSEPPGVRRRRPTSRSRGFFASASRSACTTRASASTSAATSTVTSAGCFEATSTATCARPDAGTSAAGGASGPGSG